MMTSALFAGCAAGLFAVLLHFAFVQKYILLGELYETGQLTHFSGTSETKAEGHSHTESGEKPAGAADGTSAEQSHAGLDTAGHTNGGANVGGASAAKRTALTALFMVLVYCAYGMIMVAGFAVAQVGGITVTAATGLYWGIAGFAAFQLAPAMGLAPELPGTIAADFSARQFWWWGCVAATAVGLALFGYGQRRWMYGLAAALIAAPHIIGAPEAMGYFGVAPPEVAAAFAANVLGTGLLAWCILGGVAGHFWAEQR